MDEYITHGLWKTREGLEEEFIDAWKEVAKAFANLEKPPGVATLIQNVRDSTLFHSITIWKSGDDIRATHENAAAHEAVDRARSLCAEVSPGVFRVAARVVPTTR
jgi:heme-degrading monooxygenase HmoA